MTVREARRIGRTLPRALRRSSRLAHTHGAIRRRDRSPNYKQAVGVVHKRALAESDDVEAERDRLAAEYADEHVSAEVAASTGFIDELVEPRDTRRRLAAALAALSGPGRSGNGGGNIPL